jgi:hypothetical protein
MAPAWAAAAMVVSPPMTWFKLSDWICFEKSRAIKKGIGISDFLPI